MAEVRREERGAPCPADRQPHERLGGKRPERAALFLRRLSQPADDHWDVSLAPCRPALVHDPRPVFAAAAAGLHVEPCEESLEFSARPATPELYDAVAVGVNQAERQRPLAGLAPAKGGVDRVWDEEAVGHRAVTLNVAVLDKQIVPG